MSSGCIESLGDTSVLTFKDVTLYEVRKEFNLDQPGRMKESIDRLQEWIQAQAHFNKKDFSRSYLERYIINSKGSVEAAKEALDNICTMKTLASKYFRTDVRPIDFGLQGFVNSCVIPKTTTDHQSIFFAKNKVREHTFADLRNYIIHTLHMFEYLMKYNYSKGLIAVLDYRFISISYMMTLLAHPDSRDAFKIAMNGYSIRFNAVHIVSDSKLVNGLMQGLSQVIDLKMFGRIYVHKSFDTLYEHVDKDLLPADYGGKEKPIEELSDNWDKALSTDDFLEFCKEIFAATIDTSKKLMTEINPEYLDMSGTFRSLSVD